MPDEDLDTHKHRRTNVILNRKRQIRKIQALLKLSAILSTEPNPNRPATRYEIIKETTDDRMKGEDS